MQELVTMFYAVSALNLLATPILQIRDTPRSNSAPIAIAGEQKLNTRCHDAPFC